MSDAREFIYYHLAEHDLSLGLSGLAEEDQSLVRDLAWFYDNLGALVTHGVVDLAPISGYLGQAVLDYWERLEPLIAAERRRRGESYDAQRWQVYFENLYQLTRRLPPERARESQRLWLIGSGAPPVARIPEIAPRPDAAG